MNKEDLNAEIEMEWDSFNKHLSEYDDGSDEVVWLNLNSFEDIARHFAEWQKKLDDLETADLLAIAHLQGMEQQKAKMLEDAVEGEVVQDLQGVNRVKSFGKVPEWLHFGDKVKIIIVKEDEK